MIGEFLGTVGLLFDLVGAVLLAVPGLPEVGLLGVVRQRMYSSFPKVRALKTGWEHYRQGEEVENPLEAKELYYAVIPESRRDELRVKDSNFTPIRVSRPEKSQFLFEMGEVDGMERRNAMYDFGQPALTETLVEYRVENRIEGHFFRMGFSLFLLGFVIQILSRIYF